MGQGRRCPPRPRHLDPGELPPPLADHVEHFNHCSDEGTTGRKGQQAGVRCCQAIVSRPSPLFKSFLIPYLFDSRLKSASAAKQEHARLEVENAEDDLVQKTEVAITLMKTVLENVRPIFISAYLHSCFY